MQSLQWSVLRRPLCNFITLLGLSQQPVVAAFAGPENLKSVPLCFSTYTIEIGADAEKIFPNIKYDIFDKVLQKLSTDNIPVSATCTEVQTELKFYFDISSTKSNIVAVSLNLDLYSHDKMPGIVSIYSRSSFGVGLVSDSHLKNTVIDGFSALLLISV